MRLQHYPDGANEWTIFLWGRHPKWSWTWTHSVTLTKRRPESGQRRWGAYRIPGGQRFYGIVAGGYELQLARQAPLPRRKEGGE